MTNSYTQRFKTAGARFWEKVDRSGGPDVCWPWTEGLDTYGYGQFFYEGKGLPAHRALFLMDGDTLTPDQLVLHSCDNPPCVNRLHLRIGTRADNTADMIARKRQATGAQITANRNTATGERAGLAKLTEEQVRAIRTRYAAGGITQLKLGAEYGVHQTGISRIVLGQTWEAILA